MLPRGDRIADKQLRFIELLEPVLNYLWGEQKGTANADQGIKRIKLSMWAKGKSKNQLIKEYLDNGGTIEDIAENTFTCYKPNDDERCWCCKACFRNFCSLYHNGWNPPSEVIDMVRHYIECEVLSNPMIVMNRGDETDAELSVLERLGYRL